MSEHRLLIRGSELPEVNRRYDYGVDKLQKQVGHFVIWHTTPDNPFKPHKHALEEFWFILEGEAIVTLEGQEYRVGPRDLIVLPAWVEHGLRTESECYWICMDTGRKG
ncbi:MAG: cupin domain-containing protein [Chloroflexi bacterium]|nr:cupin domain-containing protein [Chloroflexota bacterium]